jgi:hypothetical protein
MKHHDNIGESDAEQYGLRTIACDIAMTHWSRSLSSGDELSLVSMLRGVSRILSS